MSNTAALYIVATPIGNLEDLSARAVRILSTVDLIVAEDTRTSRKLLMHYGIATPLSALHEHNEREQAPRLIEQLRAGKSIALISDAGTPLISDPGYHLVCAAHAAGITVVPVPGACAAIAALSAAGLPSDRFVFEGFPPAKSVARRASFARLTTESRTLIFYESPHRIVDSLADMAAEFGVERVAMVARELTKKFETLRAGPLGVLADWIARPETPCQGEFVVLVHGAEAHAAAPTLPEAERILKLLMAELPTRQAVDLAVGVTGLPRNTLYKLALAHKPR
ncbi:MAG: 16S rRNA (cytidine(1402)-2'-O)-methyltransferase [Sulfuricaulis sp.]|nr:16S rRNA (cytidine(1402)-2'-O)-methyltransferase [Sulfuricaulis sp.]